MKKKKELYRSFQELAKCPRYRAAAEEAREMTELAQRAAKIEEAYKNLTVDQSFPVLKPIDSDELKRLAELGGEERERALSAFEYGTEALAVFPGGPGLTELPAEQQKVVTALQQAALKKGIVLPPASSVMVLAVPYGSWLSSQETTGKTTVGVAVIRYSNESFHNYEASDYLVAWGSSWTEAQEQLQLGFANLQRAKADLEIAERFRLRQLVRPGD